MNFLVHAFWFMNSPASMNFSRINQHSRERAPKQSGRACVILRVILLAVSCGCLATGLSGCKQNRKVAGKADAVGETTNSKSQSVAPSLVESGTVKLPPKKDAVAENTDANTTTGPRSTKSASEPAKRPPDANPITIPGQTRPGELRQKPRIEIHPAAGNYSEFQLGKNHTLFVLAFDSITRQNYFLNAYRELMTYDQVVRANRLVDSYDDKFARLRDARASILENATDDNPDTPILLLNNRVETLELAISVRKRIVREVLTREQRRLHKENVERRKELRERLHPGSQDSAKQRSESSGDPSKSGDDSGS